MKRIEVQVAEKLVPLLVKPKRIKIAVGGRGASKSHAFADAWLKFCADGERLLCAREFQNSIEESVHALLQQRINALGVEGLAPMATRIGSAAGGEIMYRGLSRNIHSLQSLHGIKRLWIEEGQSLSEHSINILFPTIREAGSEIWISANRGSSNDAFSRLLLKKAEKELARCGFYEDDDMIVVQINWQDNPFWNDTLEQQRRMDFERLPRATYDHVWNGAYSDTVDNAIIMPEWFDACVDAHLKLNFKPKGMQVVTHDPADSGDARALVYRHGSVIVDAKQTTDLDVNDACDWATDYAVSVKADEFVWDADGIGLGLKRQVSRALAGKRIAMSEFHGGNSPDLPDSMYEPTATDVQKARSNGDTFANRRAQKYWAIRDRCYRTWAAVVKGEYTNPDEMISFASGMEQLPALRSELCRIPKKPTGSGKICILAKSEMIKLGIQSPNLADCVMMTEARSLPSADWGTSFQQPRYALA